MKQKTNKKHFILFQTPSSVSWDYSCKQVQEGTLLLHAHGTCRYQCWVHCEKIMRGARLKCMGGANCHQWQKEIYFVHLKWQNGLFVYVCLTMFGHVMWIHLEVGDIFVIGHSHCYTHLRCVSSLPKFSCQRGKAVAKIEGHFCGLTANCESDQSCRSQLKNVPYGPTLSSSASELSGHVGTLTVAVMIFFQHTGILTDIFLIHHLPNHIKSVEKT